MRLLDRTIAKAFAFDIVAAAIGMAAIGLPMMFIGALA